MLLLALFVPEDLSKVVYLESGLDEDIALPEISLILDKLQVKRTLLRRAVDQRRALYPTPMATLGNGVSCLGFFPCGL